MKLLSVSMALTFFIHPPFFPHFPGEYFWTLLNHKKNVTKHTEQDHMARSVAMLHNATMIAMGFLYCMLQLLGKYYCKNVLMTTYMYILNDCIKFFCIEFMQLTSIVCILVLGLSIGHRLIVNCTSLPEFNAPLH